MSHIYICICICICITQIAYINVSISALCLSSYLHHICIQSVTATCRHPWGMFGQKYIFFSNVKRDFFGSVSRISSQLLFCISCPSVMRFAVSGINKQSGGSGNITECKSQGPKLICARFGDLGGGAIFALYWVDLGGIWLGGTDTRDDMLFLPMSEACIERICLKTYHIMEEEGTWESPTLQWDWEGG